MTAALTIPDEFESPARAFKQFGTLSTIDGFAVICETTGREVALRSTRRAAQGFAYQLNQAAATSPRSLAGLLGAKDRD